MELLKTYTLWTEEHFNSKFQSFSNSFDQREKNVICEFKELLMAIIGKLIYASFSPQKNNNFFQKH